MAEDEGDMLHAEQMSVTDLIMACNRAIGKMSVGNPHKLLLLNCAMAMRQLVDRLAKYEDQKVN